MTEVATKRIYAAVEPTDGWRVLVDGMWPRGIKKDEAKLDQWLKDLAPSKELRQWFGHDPEKWAEFRRRYHAELDANREALASLDELLKRESRLTLLFGARDEQHNNAIALAEYIESRWGK